MTDTYTEDEIREAIQQGNDVGMGAYEVTPGEVIAALKKPKWEPADGEFYLYLDHGAGWDIWEHTEGDDVKPNAKPMNLTQHGPAVRALREAMIRVRDEHPTQYGLWARISRDALAAFDEAIHD